MAILAQLHFTLRRGTTLPRCAHHASAVQPVRTRVNALLLALALLLFGAVPTANAQSSSADTNRQIVQVSTINALISGIFDGDTTLRELKQYGSFGIGTINHLDGEMLMLDGVSYQITADGEVHQLPPDTKTPFAAVTDFHSDSVTTATNIESFDALQKAIDADLPSPNLFYAIKITGTFPEMKVRSVPRQTQPYRSLTDVVKDQSLFTYQNTSGTVVGFRCPPFVQGINVAGYHLHFLSADKRQGGHVLGFKIESGRTEIDVLPDFKLILPDSSAFLKADLRDKNEADIHAVEQIRVK